MVFWIWKSLKLLCVPFQNTYRSWLQNAIVYYNYVKKSIQLCNADRCQLLLQNAYTLSHVFHYIFNGGKIIAPWWSKKAKKKSRMIFNSHSQFEGVPCQLIAELWRNMYTHTFLPLIMNVEESAKAVDEMCMTM